MFSRVTRSVSPDIEKDDVRPVLDKALNNFNREMRQPIEDFENSPAELKAQIFNILIKHFVMGMMNERVFMDKNISEISKQIEKLVNGE